MPLNSSNENNNTEPPRELKAGDWVKTTDWLRDTRDHRLPQGTAGVIKGKGSIKDFRVEFLISDKKEILEVNKDELT